MRVTPFGRGRRAVHGGSDEWVPEPRGPVELDQPCRLGCVHGVHRDAEPFGGAPQQPDVADRFRGGGEQHLPRPSGSGCTDAGIAARGVVRWASRRGRRPVRKLRSPAESPPGSSSSASGLPWLSATMRSRTPDLDRTGDRGLQEDRGFGGNEAVHDELREPVEAGLTRRVANREHEHHGFGGAADGRRTPGPCADAWSSHCASSTQQMNGGAVRNLREQGQHCEADQEAVGRAPRAQPERRAERFLLGAGRRDIRSSRGAHNWCRPA